MPSDCRPHWGSGSHFWEVQTYSEMLKPLLGASGGTVLAVKGSQDILEGAAPEGVVMVSFPTMEAARAFYDSPQYQAAAKHRFIGADYRSFIIEEV